MMFAISFRASYTRLNVGRQPACGFGDPESKGAHKPRRHQTRGFFVCARSAVAPWAAPGGETFGSAGFLLAGSPTPLGGRSPVWRRMAVKQTVKRGITMSHSTQGALALDVSPASTFKFDQHPVRIVLRDGEPWFVAKDVCDALGYSNSRGALADHLDDDEKGVAAADTLGGRQQMQVISESGLYALVLRSRKPEARKFAKWVTSEVLPAIRKTGSYTSAYDRHITEPTAALERALNTGRWFMSASEGRLTLKPVRSDAYVITEDQFASVIREPGGVSSKFLPEIISAAAGRLMQLRRT